MRPTSVVDNFSLGQFGMNKRLNVHIKPCPGIFSHSHPIVMQ
jgi:hypothetical protein